MKVLITGGAGFIGSNLAELHLAKNDEVYVVDNLSSGSLEDIQHFHSNKNFHFFNADILLWPELQSILMQAERVYHLAATVGMFKVLAEPVATIENNIKTTERILTIIKEIDNKPLLIIASSSEVYGNQAGLLSEETPLILETTAKNHANYPISKICNESMSLAFCHEYGIPVIVARIFNTIGQRQSSFYGMVVPRFIKQALANEPITVFNNGEQTRCFCNVRDTVNLLNMLANNGKAIGQIINVGNNELVTINQLAQLVKKLANSKSDIIYMPYDKVYQGGYIDIRSRHIDTTKLLAYTNYQYQWKLADTICDLIQQQRHAKI
jgi:UDP-glucose 4-epimerase